MRIRLGIVMCLATWAAVAQELEPEPNFESTPAGGLASNEARDAEPTVDSESSTARSVDPQSTPADETGVPGPRVVETAPVGGGSKADEDAPVEMVNHDVIQLAQSEFSDTTIVAAIRANPIRFNISPDGLLALKNAGVSEPVIEAMLAAEAERRRAEAADPVQQPAAPQSAETLAEAPPDAAAVPTEPATTETQQEILARMSPEELALLLNQVAPESVSTTVSDDAEAEHDDHSPRAWVADGDGRIPLEASMAEVAIADARRGGRFRTLQGFAGKALAFVNPVAGELGGLFRSDDPTVTAVWALPGASASRDFAAETVFEIEFGSTPGVNPDDYRPAIVQLVPTPDNYRLVGAARTKASELDGVPDEPIIEEPAAAKVTRLERGRYRVALSAPVHGGEYALVLRPTEKPERWWRRNSETSLGGLIGGASAEVLYMAWDFTIE